MISEAFVNALRTYKEPLYTKEKIAECFPRTLANSCRTMKITNILGKPQGLYYDWGQLQAFQVNLGAAIHNENYDSLDNIIIDFVNSYNYKTVTPKGQFIMFTVDFPDTAVHQFEIACYQFKGKKWNDMLNEFIDELVKFLKTVTVHGDMLEEWH